ncbi:MAG: xanthine dehydrogenase family protein [SAR324 cluster bacterium]|nr:xanthine dehydrogenase family protein [SAR324 cluster bacterium]
MANQPFSVLDRPNSYIGKSVPRPNARRLLEGRGRFADDLNLPRMLHTAFLRSPFAHARIIKIDAEKAKAAPGVILIADGKDVATHCKPWEGTLAHFPGMKSPLQFPLPLERACWQGEPVLAIAAESRAQAEDAIDLVEIEWEELPVLADSETALDPDTPLIHPELGDNQTFNLMLENGTVDQTFADAERIIEKTFHFGRHTAVTVEPRSLIADFDDSEGRLTVYYSSQSPYQMQDVFSRHLNITEDKVHVICEDIGGSFGMKLHVYGEDLTTCALSIMTGRPVKFTADRFESFVSDIHHRDHRVHAKMAVSNQGKIQAMEIDDLTGIGPYSVYPRTSAVEGNQVVRLTGGSYQFTDYRAKLNVVFQNKNVMCQYRAVGHPIACSVTEGMVDFAAAELGIDPVEMRRRNLIKDDQYPYTSPTGLIFEKLSHHQSLEKVLEMMDYDALRAEQAKLREQGIHRGIGLATFIEITNPGPAFYGLGGARISAQDGCMMKLEPSGKIFCSVSVTEQGQGTETVMAQIAASELGMPLDDVRMLTGDTEKTPYGGATWGSRGVGIGGEAVLRAARALRNNLLEVAGAVLQCSADQLDIQNSQVIDKNTGTERLSVAEIGRIAYFRSDTLPQDFHPQLTVARHYVPQGPPFAFTNGIQASYLELDQETGFFKLLKHWAVEDCGTQINPRLVEEQIRGGVVQGLGAALYEECLYDEQGQFLNPTLADYLVPMAAEIPDIQVGHVVTPTAYSELGAKGAGEAGTAGAAAAVMNALNDALRPFKTELTRMPFTPERILRALGKV